jgi:hypothetical protein
MSGRPDERERFLLRGLDCDPAASDAASKVVGVATVS